MYISHAILYFFIYAFLGWCLEVSYAAFRKRKFINRGLLSGVLCPVYGLAMVFMLVFFETLKGRLFFLFLGCFIVISVFEFATGTLLEKFFGRKCWDYTKYRDHIGTYVSVRFSLIWTVLAVLVILLLHPLLESLMARMPMLAGQILALVLLVIFALDIVITVMTLCKMKIQNEMLLEIAKGLKKLSRGLDNAITKRVERRMEKVFPSLEDVEEERQRRREEKEAKKRIFAYGCGFYKLFWLFFLGAFLGDIIETIFCYATTGRLMSRSSVVYGPFSLVWGLGIAFFTLLLHRYQSKNDRYLFLLGTVLGGAYEYICSVFTELMFGTVFWDYSKIPFNLGGRINLLYCFFWGFAAVIWMKGLYPKLSKWIEKVPIKAGKVISWMALAFMVFNVAMSGLALSRYTARHNGLMPENQVEAFIDEHFQDARMEQIYPNAIMR